LTQSSVEQPIALGRTAEIYAWEPGQVLKLFREGTPPGNVAYEARIAHAVHTAGLPVPAPGEVIEVNGRLGLIYERVEGRSLAQTLRARPWAVVRLARLAAGLHTRMHAVPGAPDLPPQRTRLEHKIRGAGALPPDLGAAALAALDRMPEGDRLCHGDFHPENILMARHGPVIIDWVDATRGAPLADVARSSVLLLGAASEVRTGLPARWVTRWYLHVYLARYFQLCPGGREEFAAWWPIVAAGRVEEQIADQQAWLLAQVRARLRQGPEA
jgi:Ser/Thr protein kinase RdoA (MazF antagonist)